MHCYMHAMLPYTNMYMYTFMNTLYTVCSTHTHTAEDIMHVGGDNGLLMALTKSIWPKLTMPESPSTNHRFSFPAIKKLNVKVAVKQQNSCK